MMTARLHIALGLAALGLGSTGCSTFGRLVGHRQHIFVSNYKDDTVSVIDCDTDREVNVIAVGDSPVGVAVRSQRPLVAVANSTGKRVTLLDPKTMEIVRTVGVGEVSEHLVFSTDGSLLFVTLPKSGRVAVIDPDAGQVQGMIDIGRKPKRLAASPDGRRLYVLLHIKNGGIAVVNLATRTVQATIPTGAFPTDFALTPDGKRLLAASFDDDNVAVIDTVALKPIATWPVATGFGVLVHPTKPLLYSMDSFDGAVHVLNYETGQAVTTLEPGDFPTYSVITPDGKYLYVVNEDSSSITKYDTETNQRMERVAVGGQPANAVIVTGP